MGPVMEYSKNLHAEKYRLENESYEEYTHRISREIFNTEHEKYEAFSCLLQEMRFLPGGRISIALGNGDKLTPMNCFVSSEIKDNLESIWAVLVEAGRVLSMGGGIGFNFSNLRPSGALVSSVSGPAGGPVNFMRIFDAQGQVMASTGGRRGAQMGVLNVDHPDIEAFIRAKQDGTSLSAFNLSVGITDEFMRAVEQDSSFDLRFEGKVYKTVSARGLWDMSMRSAWDWAEPGVLFLDTINRENNLLWCENICATNPCGEQTLPYNGCCLLGSFNLTRYITKSSNDQTPFFNWKTLKQDIPLVVEALDNLIDIARYPISEQKEQQRSKRRLGIGLTGLANTGEILGFLYGSKEFLKFTHKVMQLLVEETYSASADLAAKKGSFPILEGHIDEYLSSPFIQRSVPSHVIEKIRKQGIRNSHLLSIAPTGTMSLCADNVSSGVEPVFDYKYQRSIRGDVVTIQDFAYQFYKVRGRRVSDITPQDHLAVLSIVQKFVDSSVSKTVNVNDSIQWAEFKDLYFEAWRIGCKGFTTFRSSGKRAGILKTMCKLDPLTGIKEC